MKRGSARGPAGPHEDPVAVVGWGTVVAAEQPGAGAPADAICVPSVEMELRARLPWLERKRTKFMAPDELAAHIALGAALEQARTPPLPLEPDASIGVFVGTRMSGRMDSRIAAAIVAATDEEPPDPGAYLQSLARTASPVHQLLYLSNRVALHLAISISARGAVRTFGGSSLAAGDALADAVDAIQTGTLERALVGGVDLGFDDIGATLERIAGVTRTGPGAASVLLLEREESARLRGAKIRGRVLGCGGHAQLRHAGTPSDVAATALRRAFERAGIEPPARNASLHAPGTLVWGNATLPMCLIAALQGLGEGDDADALGDGAFVDRDLGAAAFVVEAA